MTDSRPPLDLLVVGDLNPDVIAHGVPEPLRWGQHEHAVPKAVITLGGSGALVASAAARLGLSVALVAATGDDPAAHLARALVGSTGVDTSACPMRVGQPTGLSVILTRADDRTILTASGAMASLNVAEVDDQLLSRARHVHVASYFLLDALSTDLPALATRAHNAGATVSLDSNFDPTGDWAGFPELLSHVDVFLPNQAEATAITGVSDPSAAAQVLRRWCPQIVVKLEGAAALAVDPEGVTFASGAWRVPVDTVGAGDTFDAAWLAARSWDMPAYLALRVAVAAGGLSTRAAGGLDGQPDRDELLACVPEVTTSRQPLLYDAGASTLRPSRSSR